MTLLPGGSQKPLERGSDDAKLESHRFSALKPQGPGAGLGVFGGASHLHSRSGELARTAGICGLGQGCWKPTKSWSGLPGFPGLQECATHGSGHSGVRKRAGHWVDVSSATSTWGPDGPGKPLPHFRGRLPLPGAEVSTGDARWRGHCFWPPIRPGCGPGPHSPPPSPSPAQEILHLMWEVET